MTNYGQLAFSDAAKALQEEVGNRQVYERMEKHQVVNGLTDNEIRFIQNQDHFYMASYGENGFPYIQHRGGPAGFVKILDNRTLAFVDFSGNKQYITAGNLETNVNAALIMISYPHRARLKLYAKTRIVQLTEDPELFSQIDPAYYKHSAERMMVLDIQAYDWNCPQHITPRYTSDEIAAAFAPQRQRIADLEAENKALKAQIKGLNEEIKLTDHDNY